MAKTLTESPITTRNARAALPLGVHRRRIDPETHLGYRKGKRAGVWLVRWRHGKGYRQAPLGTADDVIKNGTLAYDAALKAARDLVEKARADAAAEASGPSSPFARPSMPISRCATLATLAGWAGRSAATRRPAYPDM